MRLTIAMELSYKGIISFRSEKHYGKGDKKRLLSGPADKEKNNGLIKIVTGIRRCGKSYLLRTIFKNHLIESGVDEGHIISF